MKRRDFFLASSAAATAGLASAAVSAQSIGIKNTVPASPKTAASIFDFGAVGDGVTDDSAAFSKALQVAAVEGRMITVPGQTYAIGRTIHFSSTANATNNWGLACSGATLQSKITNGSDIVLLESNHVVRYFNITGGLSINGTGSDGNGLCFSVPTSSGKYFYNIAIDRLAVENAGIDGLVMRGNVFESQITNSYFQDCKRNGATFAHYHQGICSSINLIGCYFNQNQKYGMEATTFDSKYGGATDVRVLGGYCRQNGSVGFRYNNGTARGASVTQVGFENNCTSLSPGDPNGAHVYARVRMTMRDCMGYNEFGGATNLLRGWFSDLALLDSCSQSSGGAMKATGKSRLVQVHGSDTGHVLMRGCDGGVSVDSANHATWSADNCSGPSPSGNLDIRASIGNA